MGSFKQTCAVTHLPIAAGDPVVGYVLGKAYGSGSDDVTGYVSSGAVWQTLSLPFAGRYNDYGFVEDVEERLAGVTLMASTRRAFADIVKAGLREGEGHDWTVTAKMPRPFEDTVLMAMFVHAPLWEKLSSSTSTPYGREIRYEEEAGRIDELIDALDKAAEAEQRRRPEFGKRLLGSLREADDIWGEATGRPWTECPYAADFLVSRKTEGVHPALRHAVRNLIAQAWESGDRDTVRALLDQGLRTAIFDENMTRLRRLWTPQCGLGGDDPHLDLHAEVATWAVDHVKALEAEYAEETDDEPESGPRP